MIGGVLHREGRILMCSAQGCEESHVPDAPTRIDVERHLPGLPGIEGFQLRDLMDVLLHQIRKSVQVVRTFQERHRRPCHLCG